MSAKSVALESATPHVAAPAADTPAPRVLVAVPMSCLQDALRELLEKQGYEVFSTYDGPDTVTWLDHLLCHGERLDLLILSDGLPDESGNEILSGLSHFDWTTPVILLQESGLPSDGADALITGLLLPPFSPNGIVALVNTLVPAPTPGATPPVKRILVVDDEPDLSASITYALGGEGYLCERAASGPEALNKASWMIPDLVLLDLNLPGLDGADVCLRLRSDPSLKDTAILMLTARAGAYDQLLGKEVGADGYLVKPVELANLLHQVQEVLAKR